MRSVFLFVILAGVAQGTIQTCLEPCYYQTCDFNCGGCPNDMTIGVTVQTYMTQMQNMTNDTSILQIVNSVKATSKQAAHMHSNNYELSCDLDCQPNDQHGLCAVDCQDCNPQGLCGADAANSQSNKLTVSSTTSRQYNQSLLSTVC